MSHLNKIYTTDEPILQVLLVSSSYYVSYRRNTYPIKSRFVDLEKAFNWGLVLRNELHQLFLTFMSLLAANCVLTLQAPTPRNGQTHTNNLSATADGSFECVWPFCGVGTLRFNGKFSKDLDVKVQVHKGSQPIVVHHSHGSQLKNI